jgi:hypothetical protein
MQRTNTVARQELDVPGHAALVLRVYGPTKTHDRFDASQGFVVLKAAKPTARAELEVGERVAVEHVLRTQFPEHAQLL